MSILLRQQAPKEFQGERACGPTSSGQSRVPWSLRLSAIFPALQMHSLHTLLKTDAAGRDREGIHLFPGWSKPRDMYEAGNSGLHRTVREDKFTI